MKLKTLFKDKRFGVPQSAGNMVVIPILSDKQNITISEDMLFNIADDSDYAHLTLRNIGERPTIIPQGTSYITKQSAQDRAVLSVNILSPKGEKNVNVSCIQSSQGGHMSEGTDEFRFIPASIRVQAIKKDARGHTNYEVLWKDIEEYKKKVGLDGRAHMSDFYEKFDKDLEEFIAPFESLKNQIGAVILINNQVVGIEVYPNYKTWEGIWHKLIRDSYGTDAITVIKKGSAIAFRPIIDIDKVNSIEDLESEGKKMMEKIIDNIIKTVNTELEKEATESNNINTTVDYTISNLSIGTMKGQTVSKDGELLYLTAVKAIA